MTSCVTSIRSSTTPVSSRWSEFRARGGLWVVAQLVLMVGIAVAFMFPPEWPDEVRGPLLVAGIVLMVLGVGLVRWAHRTLGRGFTPFTRPPPEAGVAEGGPYRLARHPMYGGALLFCGGLSLVFGVVALVFTAALALLWRGKSAVEERHLSERFADYAAYRRRTPRRFLPGIY